MAKKWCLGIEMVFRDRAGRARLELGNCASPEDGRALPAAQPKPAPGALLPTHSSEAAEPRHKVLAPFYFLEMFLPDKYLQFTFSH